MSNLFRQMISRRHLLAGIARYAVLGTLGAICVAVFAKRRRLMQGARIVGTQKGVCINHGICKDCGIFEQCGLPLALSEKQLLTIIDDE